MGTCHRIWCMHAINQSGISGRSEEHQKANQMPRKKGPAQAVTVRVLRGALRGVPLRETLPSLQPAETKGKVDAPPTRHTHVSPTPTIARHTCVAGIAVLEISRSKEMRGLRPWSTGRPTPIQQPRSAWSKKILYPGGRRQPACTALYSRLTLHPPLRRTSGPSAART
jgi:hypothetical protein